MAIVSHLLKCSAGSAPVPCLPAGHCGSLPSIARWVFTPGPGQGLWVACSFLHPTPPLNSKRWPYRTPCALGEAASARDRFGTMQMFCAAITLDSAPKYAYSYSRVFNGAGCAHHWGQQDHSAPLAIRKPSAGAEACDVCRTRPPNVDRGRLEEGQAVQGAELSKGTRPKETVITRTRRAGA